MVSLQPGRTHVADPLELQVFGVDRLALRKRLVGRRWIGLRPEGVGGARDGVVEVSDPVLAEGGGLRETVGDVLVGERYRWQEHAIGVGHAEIRIARVGGGHRIEQARPLICPIVRAGPAGRHRRRAVGGAGEDADPRGPRRGVVGMIPGDIPVDQRRGGRLFAEGEDRRMGGEALGGTAARQPLAL